jgi:hypothetical protein
VLTEGADAEIRGGGPVQQKDGLISAARGYRVQFTVTPIDDALLHQSMANLRNRPGTAGQGVQTRMQINGPL